MRDIKYYPFQKHILDPQTQRFISTLYNDIVTQYEIRYGNLWELFDQNVVIGVEIEPTDNEHDIINFMNIAMGNLKVRAIVVYNTTIDNQLKNYTENVFLNNNTNFVCLHEAVTKSRTVYVRKPSLNERYMMLKRAIRNSFLTRMKWNGDLCIEESDGNICSNDAHINIRYDDNNRICTVIFKNPNKLFDECEIRIIIEENIALSSIVLGDVIDDNNKALVKRDDTWLTEVQCYFIDDLNKIFEYCRLKYRRD